MKNKSYEELQEKINEGINTIGEWPHDLGNSDWKDNPGCTLIEIDMKLKPFGLEVLQYDTKSDFYAWEIVKRDE